MSGSFLHPEVYSESVERRATRDGFGEGLLKAAENDQRVVGLVADLRESVRMDAFARAFPERFFEVGVAEQNLVTVSSGMAAAGKIPFAASYAVFSPGRTWEQIRTTICYNDVSVKLVGSHAGISVGPDGATHQALEDIALMRVLPNMTVLSPCDAHQACLATLAAAKAKGPVYLRLAREKSPQILKPSTPFLLGKIQQLVAGNDVSLVATGPLVYEALLAAKALQRRNVRARVLNVHTIKPLDAETLVAAAKATGAFVTIEEHQVAGGLGSAVAEVLAQHRPIPITFVGIKDEFGESGNPGELMQHFGLTAPSIVRAALEAVKRKALGALR